MVGFKSLGGSDVETRNLVSFKCRSFKTVDLHTPSEVVAIISDPLSYQSQITGPPGL